MPTATAFLSNGKAILYRGDTRSPDIIKRDGFQLWGEAIANVSKARGLGNYLSEICGEKHDGKAFADWVRVSKDRGRPTVSTAKTEDCGGYSSDYIYKIEVTGLQQYRFDATIFPSGFSLFTLVRDEKKLNVFHKQPITKQWKDCGLVAYMNAPNLSSAKIVIIDLQLKTGECAFFTKIPPENITEWRSGKGKEDFNLMSDIQAAPYKQFA